MNQPQWLNRYLHPGELIVFVLYHSWVVIFKVFLGCFLFAIIPIALGLAFPQMVLDIQTHSLIWLLVILGGSVYYFGLLLFLLMRYVDYHLDFWIITSERLISIEQKSLFSQRISEQEFGVIQDITSEIYGLVSTILNYGDVQVRTASERPAIIIDEVPDPHGVRRKLFQLIEQQRLRRQNVTTETQYSPSDASDSRIVNNPVNRSVGNRY